MISKLVYNETVLGYRIKGFYGEFDFSIESRGLYNRNLVTTGKDIELIVSDNAFVTKEEISGKNLKVKDISDVLFEYELFLKIEGVRLTKDIDTGYDIKTGVFIESMLDYCNSMKPRWYIDELFDCFVSGEKQVTEIVGVRRTGKTISMWHLISKLRESGVSENDIAFITVGKRNFLTCFDISSIIMNLYSFGVKYIFIDEITFIKGDLEDLVQFGGVSKYPRILITGTDSANFIIFNGDEFFDRAQVISSSYISYKEFKYLYENVNFTDYMRTGGILYSNSVYKESHSWSYDIIKDRGKQYFSTSIYGNMLNTFDRYDSIGRYFTLSGFISEYSKYSLEGFVSNLAQYFVIETALKRLGTGFYLSDIGKLKNVLKGLSDETNLLIKNIAEEFSKYIKGNELWYRKLSSKSDKELVNTLIKELINFLYDIGCLYKINRIVCIWPFNLRIALTDNIVSEMQETNMISDDIADKLIELSEGDIIEEMIRLNLFLGGAGSCDKFRNNETGLEVDIITDNDLIEVKRSDKMVVTQVRWLVSGVVEEEFGDRRLIVLYNGKDVGPLEISEYDVINELIKDEKNVRRIEKLKDQVKYASKKKKKVYWRNYDNYLIENTYKNGKPSFIKYS